VSGADAGIRRIIDARAAAVHKGDIEAIITDLAARRDACPTKVKSAS
jgi:hypothetical protein